ncbi:hypothetical protein HDG34_003102 [Paraburkholderia sp. HC6.4b]|uniref:hypothetical protein n=1 Tax=unclassified Paraburkholderia TaxID=2615204 RepID=UPI00161E9E6C|nr:MULTISPECIES: hypothetical protein [unclassified Paraburkholderia]MBB5409161.1 hypothetical protein [Paraburkholderia sp. HC6.4b]MBB5450889.1 hypothetical protein [Paraburkholderia sp. Kb1A]
MEEKKKPGFVARVCEDLFCSWNGDVDPARFFGYGFVMLGGLVFIILSIYDTIKHQTFNSLAFSGGLVAIAGAVTAAAAGVKIKESSEIPMPTETIEAVEAEIETKTS